MSNAPAPTPAPPPPPAPAQRQPDAPKQRFRIPPWLIVVTLLLFAVNYWAASRATETAGRVRVPYSPFFIQQVNVGNVDQITSKGTAIQGTFNKKTTFEDAKPTTKFKTEIPTFANE